MNDEKIDKVVDELLDSCGTKKKSRKKRSTVKEESTKIEK